MKKIKSFDILENGQKIISPIDNEVTGFRIDQYDGEMYLTSESGAFPIDQFDVKDFYFYDGVKNVGEIDDNFFKK